MSHQVISKRPFLERFGRKSKTEAVCLKKERKKSPLLTVTFLSQREGGWLWNRWVQGGALFICHVLPLQPGVKSPNLLGGKIALRFPVNQMEERRAKPADASFGAIRTLQPCRAFTYVWSECGDGGPLPSVSNEPPAAPTQNVITEIAC